MFKLSHNCIHFIRQQGNAFKTPQARFHQFVIQELPDAQARFRKGRGSEIKLPASTGSQKKQGNSRKTSISASLTTLNTSDCVDHNKLWKIPKEMGIPDHFTCLLKNLYAGQEVTVIIKPGSPALQADSLLSGPPGKLNKGDAMAA